MIISIKLYATLDEISYFHAVPKIADQHMEVL